MGLISRWKARVGHALAQLESLDSRTAGMDQRIAALETEARAASERLQAVQQKASESASYGAVNHYLNTSNGERSALLLGRIAAQGVPDQLADLAQAEFKVFSQWGEDGIIDWLARTVPVPNRRFVEFGVENFSEANCRFLLQNRNWQGLVMDGSQAHMDGLRNERLYWMFDLTAKTAFITAENINDLIKEAGFDGPLGILSVDIDGNDYWVWDAIDCVDPAIIICEYNPILGDTQPITVAYKPDFNRFDGHHSGLYFGSSIAALKSLAKRKGYTFAGANSNGINAFFVRNDLAHHVLDRLDTVTTWPSRHRDSRDVNAELCFIGGIERFTQMDGLPVINVETGETVLLDAAAPPYSPEWLKNEPTRELSGGVGSIRSKPGDAQVQAAWLASEVERLNNLYEAAVSRIHQLELNQR